MTRDIHTTQDSASHEERADAPLPVVDLQGFRSGDGGSRQAVAGTIGAACESIGFIYVANHGVPQQTIDAALAATRSFFARPAEEKRAVARPPRTYRGYIPMMPFSEDRDSGERYLYEAFIVGPELEAGAAADMRWPNLWPDGAPELRVALMSYYRALTTLSDHLLEAFAMALGQRDDALRGYFERPMTNISLLHYPARPEGAGQDAANARPHFDTNALTILLPGASGGLEVAHHGRGWAEVPPRAGCFVVNIGNMMEAWSAGRFRSTMHRVHPPAGRERFSIAYFASPDYDTVVAPLPGLPSRGEVTDVTPLHAGKAFRSFVAGFDGR